MALIEQLNAATKVYWLRTEPVDILHKGSALLWKLMGNAFSRDNWEVKPSETVDGGTMIKVPLEYQGSHRGGYGPQTVIDTSKKALLDAARFRWAGAHASNALNLDDKIMNSGEEAAINLSKTYVKSVLKAVRVQMAEDVLRNTSSDTAPDDRRINGLGDLFNTTSATEYGSIAENNMSSWKANVVTTSEAISFEVMQKIFRQPGFGSHRGALPNFCITTTALRDGYERSLHPQQVYYSDDMIEAGWDNIMHKGAPIVADTYYDDNCSGYLDALNLEYLHLRSHQSFNFTPPEWVAMKESGQPDNMYINCRWVGNLLCTNRQMHVRHTNLSEPA